MSTNDISSRLQTLEKRLGDTNPSPAIGGRPRPNNLGGPALMSSSRQRIGGLQLPTITRRQEDRIEPETAHKLKQIMQRNGILTINSIDYKTDFKDLDDLGELGNGTSGHVVKMKHKLTDTIIAVKQMRRTNNSEENKRITMDIDVVLKSHDCPYIVHCLGCFITDAEVWICMELMATCFDKLMKKSTKPVPEQILGKVTVATVKALSYLKNSHDVIHRDVKPSNILIDERGNIKLCDFGISGRLVDSKAKTRSAGCAAYMAPERIDPKKPEYDIRADVWSLGITLVELATGSFPYKGCNTDFEVLTCVLENDPPSLPTDQGFSLEFRTFVQKCLTKNVRERPKYAELLETEFLRKYEKIDVDVAAWFASVMHQTTNSNELHRRPSLIADKKKLSSTIASVAAVTTSNIPVYQLNNSISQPMNGCHDQQLNPFQFRNQIIKTNENLTINNQANESINEMNRLTIKSPSPHQISTTSLNGSPSAISTATTTTTAPTQFTFNNVTNLSRTPSINERDCPLPMMPTNFSIPRTVASPNFTERFTRSPLPIPHEFVKLSNNQMPSTVLPVTMPIEQERLITEQRQSISPQMMHFQQIEERMVDQLNELYKATMLMHQQQQQQQHQQQRREHDEIDQMQPPQYLQRDMIYNEPGHQQILQRNNSLSPYLQRKYSLQTTQHRPNDQNVNRWRTNSQYGKSISATASPNLDGRRRYQTAIPVLDDDRTQMVRLKGNTSPIVLQRFYHQQSQLREREANQEQQYYHHVQHPQYIQEAYPVEKDESHTNPFMKHIPKLTQKLNPFKQQQQQQQQQNSQKMINGCQFARKEAIYANVAMNQKSYDQFGDMMPRENVHRQRIPVTPPVDIYNNYERTTYGNYQDHYPAEYKNAYNMNAEHHHGTPIKSKKPNGTNHRDDPGWFNSIASVVKRRFASYVKSHLGDGGNNKKDRENYVQHPMQPTSPYHFEKLRTQFPTTSASASMPSSPHFGNRAEQHYERERLTAMSPRLLNNVDRRHRSPDPPPRYNKGQSPLLLRRNLLEYGNHQVAPSPLLPRRYITSSPPLPPPRKGSDSIPGSPQQFRARVHYTPEPQRRIYRTIDQ